MTLPLTYPISLRSMGPFLLPLRAQCEALRAGGRGRLGTQQ